jgi:transcriptional regulator with XRE-family HTH domain
VLTLPNLVAVPTSLVKCRVRRPPIFVAVRTIGERLAYARKLRKLTQRGLAKEAGLTGSHVGLIETGRSGSPESATVEKLARALGVPFEWLATGEGDSPSSGDRPAARYPNAEEAIVEMGAKWDDGTVAALRSWGFRSPTDFPVDTWISIGNQIQRARRAGQQIGRPLPDEDDTPPAGR